MEPLDEAAGPDRKVALPDSRAGRVRLVAEDTLADGDAAPDLAPRAGWSLPGIIVTALIVALMVGALVIILLGVFQVKST